MAHAVTGDGMPFAGKDGISLALEQSGHLIVGVAERNRLLVLKFADEDARTRFFPWKAFQDHVVVAFGVDFQKID